MFATGVPRFMLDLRDVPENADIRKALMKPKLERFIGVIYRPDTERWSHYSEVTCTDITVLSHHRRFTKSQLK